MFEKNDSLYKSEKRLQDVLVTCSKAVFFAFLAFTFACIIYYHVMDKEKGVDIDEPRFIEEWTVINDNGDTFKTGRELIENRRYKNPYTIIATLPEDIKDNEVLCYAACKSYTVYIDGQVRYEFNEDRDMVMPGGAVKTYYRTLQLRPEDSGKEIRMVRISVSRHPEIVPVTFVSTLGGAFYEMMKNDGLSFFMSLVLLMFSLAVIIVALVFIIKNKKMINMFYGSFAIFIVACWLVTNSYMYPIAFGHYHIDGISNYMFCLMLPFCLIFYMDMIQKQRFRKVMSILLVISSLDAIIWTVLHLTEVYSYSYALPYINLILGMIVVAGFVLLLIDLKKGHLHEYIYTAVGLAGFMSLCVLEIIMILFFKFRDDSIPILLGLIFMLALVVIQQVDDLKKINEEKQRAVDMSNAKTRFLASMSHEIRTPINSILGMNEMILRENDDEVIDKYARSVRSSGKMLLTLVNDVLDFSKIEAGKVEINKANYSLSRLLSEIMPLIRERSDDKSLDFITKIKGEIPDGQYSDEFRIKQILINIINNAVKYTDEGSVILSVSGKYRTEDIFELNLDVSDTGRGIKKEELPNLFDAFSRADMGKNRNIEGTGLGLAIVKSVVDTLGGTIDVESEYGKGSKFMVMVPVKVTDKTPVSEDFESGFNRNDVKEDDCEFTAPEAKVLAVDDNHSNLTIVKLFLKRTGIIPDLCSNGDDAVKKCKEKKYDLILLDHMMPKPDGVETLKTIKNDKDSLNRDTTAIVLTANALAGSRQMYMDAGFADYLTKPVEAKVLEDTVKRYLPKDKILNVDSISEKEDNPDDFIEEFLPEDNTSSNINVSLKERLSEIEGMDYDVALSHAAHDDEVLKDILSSIVDESHDRIERMRKSVTEKNFESYEIDAHAVKGLMATIGVQKLHERAKQHEFAAKDKKYELIEEDSDGLIEEYASICEKIKKAIDF
ncbi:MAG: response regulator [Lachnospiraceae bacterium]|nr:response regulator [Lachnospiraceae bacterium]